MFHGVDKSSLHVTALSGSDGGVDQTFPPAHGVEKEFGRSKSGLEARADEAVRFGGEIAALEMRSGPADEAPVRAPAPDRLLADGRAHLGQVEHRTPGPGPPVGLSVMFRTNVPFSII